MTLRLNGSTSGYTEIDAPAVAGSNTLVLPTGNGSADQVIGGNGSGTLSWVDRTRMTLASSVATTSGTAIDFTSIPSWVKRITLLMHNISTNGTDPLAVQLGTSAGLVTSPGSYNCGTGYIASNGTANGKAQSNCLIVSTDFTGGASNLYFGHAVFTLLSSNIWVMSGASGTTSGTYTGANVSGGSISLPGTLDRLRFGTTNNTNTFDSGSVNILYEG